MAGGKEVEREDRDEWKEWRRKEKWEFKKEIQSAGVREKERGREGWKERGEERKKKERLRKGRVKRRAERVRGRGGSVSAMTDLYSTLNV